MSETALDRAEEIKRVGYTIFRNFLPEELAQMLRNLATARRIPGEIYTLGEDIFDVAPEAALTVAASPDVLDVMEAIVGPSVQLDYFSIVGVSADCDAGISWHRDPFGSVPRGSEFQKPLCLNLLVYLQDLHANVGPLRLIPGSHREPLIMSQYERSIPHHREELHFLAKGDAILLHNNVVHSRSRNFSGADRIHVSILYNMSFMRQHLVFSPGLGQIVDKIEEIGDLRLLRLFGKDLETWTRINSGFMCSEEEAWAAWLKQERK
jgi:hypothetical protein